MRDRRAIVPVDTLYLDFIFDLTVFSYDSPLNFYQQSLLYIDRIDSSYLQYIEYKV